MHVASTLVLVAALVFAMPVMAGTVTTLSGLRQAVSGADRVKTGLHLEGTVRAIGGNDSRWLVLEDASDVVVLELPEKPSGVAEGHRLSIRSQACEITRGPLAIELGSGPLIDVDGHHPPVTREASLHLAKGFHPIRVEWFNGYNTSALKLEFAGSGIPRGEVPAERFFHREPADGGAAEGAMLPGLNYHNYTGRGWPGLPEFSKLEPVSSGVIATVDLSKRARDEESGIVFSGFFHAPEDGDYRFFLTSDDGGSLRIGRPDLVCAVTEAADVAASPPAMQPSRSVGTWESIEGSVVFANQRDGHLELDLMGELSAFQVVVTDGEGLRPVDYMRRAIRVKGVVTGGKVTVIDRADLEFAGEDAEAEGTLTRILDVRRLSRVEAARSLGAKVRGVVTMVMRESLVIQDSSGGVFVHYPMSASARIPRAGEVWEIEGTTDPGDFSPVIMARRGTFAGIAPLPPPVKPTAEQLASGSLDAEQLEIEGVVISVSRTRMVLLNGQREIEIDGHSFYSLPLAEYDREGLEKLVGAVVRIRGVLAPVWNPGTRRVDPGRIRLGNAVMTVDEPSPEDPFDMEPVRAADLFLFSSHPTAFRRVKVAGTVLHARPPEYFIADGERAFRVMARGTPDLHPGDRVEAVGFPKLDGLAPVLMEADVKAGGHVGLPAATVVQASSLPSPGMDSSRVSVEGVLLGDTTQKNDRLLELRAGNVRFVARLAGGNGQGDRIEKGSLLRVTGIYAASPGAQADAVSDPFELLLNGMEDVRILERGPWWTTGHTIALVAILSGGLLLALVWGVILRRMVGQRGRQLAIEIEERQTLERHREMEQERSRVARDLHDELGASLTEAGILSTLVKDPRVPAEKKDDYLDQLSEICRKMVTGLDEIVWAVNPRYDSVSDLAGYYSMYAQRFLGLAGITCRLEIDDDMEARPLDSHVRHGIFLAFKEALNNIVRHSGAKQVRLSIAITGNELKVSLADDGCGMAPGMLLPGSDGLAGMERRMQTLGGFCRVKSGAGEGTTVELGLPLERSVA